MAIRANKLKNFKGKAYVVTDEFNDLLSKMQFATTSAITSTNTPGSWLVNFGAFNDDAVVGTVDTKAVDLTAIKDYIDNKSITVTAGNGIAINDETNPLSPTISTDIKIVKKQTANTGYVASYQLMIKDYNNTAGAVDGYINAGEDIDLIKDQFLKNAKIVYGTGLASTLTGTTADLTNRKETISDTDSKADYKPYLELTFALKGENVGTAGEVTDTDAVLYVDMNMLFDSYTAGNSAISATDLLSNKITVVIDDGTSSTNTIYTAKGSDEAILTIGTKGIHVADVQSAIDLAVNDEHTVASTAISAVNAEVEAFESSVNSAIATTVTNVDNQISATISNVNTKVDNAIKATSATISALDSGVAAFEDTVNTAIATVVSNVDKEVQGAVSSVNEQVSAALDLVKTDITNVNTSVDNLKSSVNSAITSTAANVKTVVDDVVGDIKESVNSAIGTIDSSVSAFADTTSATIDAVQSAVNDAVVGIDTSVSAAVSVVNDNITTVTQNVMQLIETSASIPLPLTNGSAVITVATANNVLAVYGDDDIQIYPEIKKVGTGYTLTADYGTDSSTHVDTAWKILYTIPVSSITPVTVTSMEYTPATNTVAYSDNASVDFSADAITAGSAEFTADALVAAYTDAEATSAATATATYTPIENGVAYTSAVKADIATAGSAAYNDGTTVAGLTYKTGA